jgi:hypothetical protein
MSKKLAALFESQILSDETKVQLQEAFDNAIEVETSRIEAEAAVKLEEATKAIISNAVSLIDESVAEEMAAIQEEIVHARTLDVQYAERLQLFQEQYDERSKETVGIMVDQIVAEEMAGIAEDIEVAKKYQFVMSMFESFKSTYEQLFGSDSDLSVVDKLHEAQAELDKYRRSEKLNEHLSIFTGRKRLIAESMLSGVPTDKIDARFAQIRDVLIAEQIAEPADVAVVEHAQANPQQARTVVLENVSPPKGSEQISAKQKDLDLISASLKRI